ncbi:MCE family protein [Aeromicrobium duanguangcaii]|uniref:MCE family protein n=1 Tax=Aeromicrobium duanguangcaii TaxID=2968086 RepID=A0ABY5KDE1_9ACTN|nr:MCE family protein [Aeromicrobium duanguangcaii]MCD9155420.1 MCE family protein [Aeromicrobium duanguangcaii]UUI68309.1 MCE family protein [Aeromicrobium duanguangcaii]
MATVLSRLSSRTVAIVAAAVCLALVAVAAFVVLSRSDENVVTVDFDRTVSLYEGSSVRILGVTVGTVEKLTPRGQNVRARIAWDADYEVPADVQAVIVSPSVVGDRFVQLTPAYTGGAKLEDGAHLDQSRTATPTELDDTYAALDRVATTLGPKGINKDGTLSDLVANSADNLDGKGAEIRESIAALAKLTKTVDGNKTELFTSVEKIERFVSALEANDQSVRDFNSSLAGVSGVLADEGDDLQLAVAELATALQQVQSYVSENRTALRKNVKGLSRVTGSLAKQRKDLQKILDQGPKALSNLALAYNPTTGTLDSRASIKGSKSGAFSVLTEAEFISGYCGLASRQNEKYEDACYALTNVLRWLAESAPGAKPAPGQPAAQQADPVSTDPLAEVMGVS